MLTREGGNDLTAYLRYPDDGNNYGNRKWPPNHTDPYLYVSFSFRQFVEVYGDFSDVQNLLNENSLAELDTLVAEKFKALTEQGWIGQAHLPIRFLPPDISAQAIKNKNVYFIASDAFLNAGSGRTYTFSSPFLSRVKLSTFPLLSLDTLTNQDIYIFWHESAHALTEAKHSRFHHMNDVPPFVTAEPGQSELDCTKTVMAYQDDCSLLTNSVSVYTFDEDGILLSESRQPDPSQFPTELGSLDLAVAAEFVASWNARNQQEHDELMAFLAETDDEDCNEAASTKKITGKERILYEDPEIPIVFFETTAVIRQRLSAEKKPASSWVNRGLKWAASQLRECESYFPPSSSLAHQRYWQHSSTWGNASSPLLFDCNAVSMLTATATVASPCFLPSINRG